jgi:hypothetical protein
MKWSVSVVAALALGAGIGTADIHIASAQMMGSPSPCDGFIPLRNAAQQKGMAIGVAEKRHANPKELCTLVSRFYLAEGAALKYLEANQAWCAIPEQAIAAAKENHAKTLKFRKSVCTAAVAPKPHIPTLSDAIGGPELDTAKNTKTGNGGTFDTLTGNPLAR